MLPEGHSESFARCVERVRNIYISQAASSVLLLSPQGREMAKNGHLYLVVIVYLQPSFAKALSICEISSRICCHVGSSTHSKKKSYSPSV